MYTHASYQKREQQPGSLVRSFSGTVLSSDSPTLAPLEVEIEYITPVPKLYFFRDHPGGCGREATIVFFVFAPHSFHMPCNRYNI